MKQKKNDIALISNFYKLHIVKLVFIFFIGILASLITIIVPVSIGKFYDLEFHFNSKRSHVLDFLPSGWLDNVNGFIIFFTVLVLLKFLTFTIYRFQFRKLGEHFIKYTKDLLFQHQLYVLHHIYVEKGTNKYLLRYSGDINSLKRLFNNGTLSAFIDTTICLIGIVWLFSLNFKGGIIILIGSVLAFTIIVLINKRIEKHSFNKRNLTSGQLSFVSRTFKAVLSIIAFNKQPTEIAKYKKRTDHILKEAVSFIKWDAFNRGFISFFQYALLIPVFYLFHLDNEMSSKLVTSGGELVSFILLYITILPILRRLLGLPTVYKLGFISLNKLNEIFELPKEITSKDKLIVNNPRLELIDFSIRGSEVLNFKSKKHQTAILKMPSGLSQIDLIKAILRISEDYQGRIMINKEDIRKFDSFSIRKNVAVAFVPFPFLGRKVYEAISYSRDTKSMQRSKECLEEVFLQFELPQSLFVDSYMGENGDQLTSIEKEIISLVRALNQRKKILIVGYFPILNKLNRSKFRELIKKTCASVVLLK